MRLYGFNSVPAFSFKTNLTESGQIPNAIPDDYAMISRLIGEAVL